MHAPNATSLTALALGGLFCLAQGAAAQSLAEVAAKQKENRKGKQSKVYTEEDLKRSGPRGGAPAEGAAGGGESAAAAPAAGSQGEGGAAPAAPKSDDELKAERETAWREKLIKARDNVTQLTSEVSRTEAALGDLTVSVYGAARANRLTALDRAKQQLVAAQQTVADLEEEGRRNGFR